MQSFYTPNSRELKKGNPIYKAICCLLLVLLGTAILKAQTTIPDKANVSGIWTLASSPYIFEGDAIVQKGDTLIIEPGVELRFRATATRTYNYKGGELHVKGKLVAKGTSNQKIRFTRQGDKGEWGSITIFPEADSNSVIDHCLIEYGGAHWIYNDTDFGALLIYHNRGIQISNSCFKHNENAIFSFNSSPLIYNCVFDQNYNAIYTEGSFKREPVLILNNTFVRNRGERVFWIKSNDLVANCIFQENNVGYNFYLDDKTLSHCLFSNGRTYYFEGDGLSGDGIIYNTNAQLNTDYSLKSNSPAINAGLPITHELLVSLEDVLDQNRLHLGRIDIGATEFQGNSFLHLSSPKRKEGFYPGSAIDITWKGNANQVNLFYSADEVNWHNIANHLDAEGTYKWQLPEDLSGSFKIKVEDATDPSNYDECDYLLEVVRSNIAHKTELKGRLTKEFSPYTVMGDLVIKPGDTLVIDPGVVLKFNNGLDIYKKVTDQAGCIYVEGTLLAQGTENEKITFTRLKEYGYWKGISLNNGGRTKSIIDQAIIEYAGGSIEHAGIRVNKSDVAIQNSIIRNNEHYGIYANGDISEISNNVIAKNVAGIFLNPHSSGTLGSNTIYDNEFCGILANNARRCKLVNLILWGNGRTFGFKDFYSQLHISYSLISEKLPSNRWSNRIEYGDGNLVGMDPMMVAPEDFDMHLLPESACIDAGDPGSPFSQEPLENGGRINIGAYGNTPYAATTQNDPRVISILPGHISIFGGDTVSVYGSGFGSHEDISRLQLESIEVEDIILWQNDQIAFTTPPMPVGSANMEITNNLNKTGILRNAISIMQPGIEDMDPVYSRTDVSSRIEFKGKNFGHIQGTSRLFFGSKEASNYVSWSDTLIVVDCPVQDEGFVDLKFEAEPGIEYTFEESFLYSDKEVVEVCGDVYGTWENGKVYLLTCDNWVSQQLTIEPGVVVMAKYNASNPIQFNVDGRLVANGNISQPIEFKAMPSIRGAWEGLVFEGDTSSINHCHIRDAVDGIILIGGRLSISNSLIFENLEAGIKSKHSIFGSRHDPVLIIEDSEITHNKVGLKLEAYRSEAGHSEWIGTRLSKVDINNNAGNAIELHTSYITYDVNGKDYALKVNLDLDQTRVNSNGGHAIYIRVRGEYVPHEYDDPYGNVYGSVHLLANNCIFSGNKSGVKAVKESLTHSDFDLKFNNSVFYQNQEPIELDKSKAVFANTSFWEAGRTVDISGYADSLVNCNLNQLVNVPGSGNISADPLYLDPASGDFSLQHNSPNIDAGSNGAVRTTIDFAGNPRIVNSTHKPEAIVDIGAIEFQGPATEVAVEICEGEDYLGLTEPGEHTVKLKSQSGIDSMLIVSLGLLPRPEPPVINISFDTLRSSEVPNINWFHNNALIPGQEGSALIIAHAGNYYATATDSKGCISQVSNSMDVYLEEVVICIGEDYQGWSASGTYSRKLAGSSGDSIVVTSLTVNPLPTAPNIDISDDQAFSDQAQGNQWFMNNEPILGETAKDLIITEAGKYYAIATDAKGCESVTSNILDVYLEEYEICEGEDYLGWTSTGKYSRKLPGYLSDSIVITNLVVNPLPTAPKIDISDDVAISDQTQSNQWYRNQEPLAGEEAQELVIDQAGKYHATATDDKGCVSLASNALDVYTEAVEICEGDNYEGWTAAGNYSRKLVSSQGDSIVITGLTVNPLPAQPEITQDNDTLYSSADSGNQWFLDDEQIEGANSESHVVEQSGSYHIVVTNAHGCASEPSEKLQVTLTSIGAPDASQLQIYPNPIEDELFVTGIELAKPAKLRIYDELGTLVHEQELSNGQARIKLGYLPKGSYFLLVQGHEQQPIKLIKK